MSTRMSRAHYRRPSPRGVQSFPMRAFLILSVLLSSAPLGAAAQPCRGPGARPSDGAKPAGGPVQGLRITPNPWRSDRNANSGLTFSVPAGLNSVMLYTAAGKWLRTLHCVCAQVTTTWDLTNDQGQPVKSGLYIYVVRDVTGRQSRGTLAVLK